MGKPLDVPEGLTVTPAEYEPGVQGLHLYTGRFAVLYDSEDVRRLVAALQEWLAENGEASDG